jgi:hypothetical protein
LLRLIIHEQFRINGLKSDFILFFPKMALPMHEIGFEAIFFQSKQKKAGNFLRSRRCQKISVKKMP